MTFVPQSHLIGLQPIAETSTTQNHPLGTIIGATSETYGAGEFIYLSGQASTGIGSWVVTRMDDGVGVMTTADAKGPVAVAMSANLGSQFGWYQISGKAVGQSAAGYVDNAAVYLTASAGIIDDAVVAGDRVKGARGASAYGTPSSNLAEFEIDRPFVDDIAD